MRVLLISEGSHEGHPAPEKPQALQAIVKRVLPSPISYQRMSVRDLPRGNPLPGKGGGHLKLAMKAMLYATRNAFDAVILVTDADRKHERIAEFDAAQNSIKFPIPRALGIAVEEFDAWILADQKALSQVLGQNVPMQRDPESIRHPKEVCLSLMKQYGWTGTQAEFYEAVCQSADLEVLATRCPKGFRPFLNRLKILAEAAN